MKADEIVELRTLAAEARGSIAAKSEPWSPERKAIRGLGVALDEVERLQRLLREARWMIREVADAHPFEAAQATAKALLTEVAVALGGDR